MNDHVTKPINPEELFSVISKWCSANRYGKQEAPLAGDFLVGLEDVLNIDFALGRIGGNKDLFLKMLLKAREDVPPLLVKLHEQHATNDIAAMATTLRSLSSLFGSIGAQVPLTLVKALENSISEDVQPCTIARLETVWKTIADALQNLGG